MSCAVITAAPRVAAVAPVPPELDPAAHARLVRIVETRGFTRGLPRKPVPSPDGSRVYFLRSGPDDAVQSLYVFDGRSGATTLVADGGKLAAARVTAREQSRRERARETESGITDYEVSRDGRRLLIPYAGDLFLVDTATGDIARLTETEAAEIDPHLSPDASRVSFVRGGDLFDIACDTRTETILAHSDTAGVSYGSAEFVAQEEMDRRTGHWWSPDSRWLALTAVDERAVPSFEVPNFKDPTGAGSSGPYPKPGDPNARVRLGVVPAAGGTPRWFDLGADIEYLARVYWAPDSQALWVETQPRNQKRLDLCRIDCSTGRLTLIRREIDPDWVNLHDDFHWLDTGARFVWSSEHTGVRRLEVRRADGRRERVLTPDGMNVDAVAHADETGGQIFFTAWEGNPLELHLYRVPARGGKVMRLSSEPGWHEVDFHPHGDAVYVENFSDERTPPRFRVHDRDGKMLGELPATATHPGPEDLGPVPRFRRAKGPGGAPLDLRVVMPSAGGSPHSLPLVVYVYGGPHGQQVRRRWGGERDLFDGWLAERGFVVARIDGRGVPARGHASEHIYAGRLGEHEVDDQVAGVKALVTLVPEIDAHRVGIWGWSYGGYMTLMCMARAPDVFLAGVAVAPVVDWHGYDTHYTERYLGLPGANAAGYTASSVLTWAPQLRGALTLVHGASDDNVHARESMLLLQKFIDLDHHIDLMIYPGTHMIQSTPERTHLYELVWRTFATHL